MPIYTKKGDRGETGLFSGERVLKSSALIEAIGTVDELNAQIGLSKINLRKIQEDLFAIGSRLAGHKTNLDLEKRTTELEKEIDEMWGEMPPLKNFILPRGEIHVARAVCRRAERQIVALGDSGPGQNDVKKYLNRLSDYLFCLARFVNFKNGVKEKVWMG